jgi:tetratricopeptide (TPR) repeat protein
MTMQLKWIVVLASVLACAGGGVTARKLTADEEARVVTLTADADKANANRHVEAELRRAVQLFEEVVKLDPVNKKALTELAKAYYSLAYAFTNLDDARKEDEKERDRVNEIRKGHYFKGRDYGLRALKTNDRFARAMDSGASYQAAVGLVDADYADALGWTAASWGRWGELMGVTKVAMDIPKVKAIVERARKLNPGTNFGGPHRFLGAYYLKIPKFAGQNPKLAKKHFLKAIEIAPSFLENRLLYAEYYATYADDQTLFKEQLEMIIKAADDTTVPYRLENLVAKKRAAEMLKNVDKYF